MIAAEGRAVRPPEQGTFHPRDRLRLDADRQRDDERDARRPRSAARCWPKSIEDDRAHLGERSALRFSAARIGPPASRTRSIRRCISAGCPSPTRSRGRRSRYRARRRISASVKVAARKGWRRDLERAAFDRGTSPSIGRCIARAAEEAGREAKRRRTGRVCRTVHVAATDAEGARARGLQRRGAATAISTAHMHKVYSQLGRPERVSRRGPDMRDDEGGRSIP